jgi:lambda family phage portal protein
MLGTFDDASLEKQILQANYGAVIKSDVNYETAMQLLGATGHKRDGNWENPAMGPALDQLESSSEYHNEMNILFNGSRIPHLVPGEEIQLLESHTNGVEQKEFVDGMIRRLAAGTGVSFESLARNFSDTSYSAARMSLAETWRHFEVTREHLNKRFAMPYVGAWMAEGILEGRLDMPDGIKHNPENWFKFRTGLVQGEFISWTKPLIDPVKEQKGRHLALAMGTSTLESHAAADGEDWQINLEQRAREKKKREELGLNPEDIDPTLAFSGTGSSGQEGNEGGGSGSG